MFDINTSLVSTSTSMVKSNAESPPEHPCHPASDPLQIRTTGGHRFNAQAFESL